MRDTERNQTFAGLVPALEAAGYDFRWLHNGLLLMGHPFLVLWTGERFDLRRVLTEGPPYEASVGTAAEPDALVALLAEQNGVLAG